MTLHANPYYRPEEMGLETVGEIDWIDEAYEFDLTVVWLHVATGDLYFADDEGCSCPAPFENHRTLRDLTKVNRKQELVDHLADKRSEVGANQWRGHNAESLTNLDRSIGDLTRKVFELGDPR